MKRELLMWLGVIFLWASLIVAWATDTRVTVAPMSTMTVTSLSAMPELPPQMSSKAVCAAYDSTSSATRIAVRSSGPSS